MSEVNNASLDSLLDSSIDDLADMPAFAVLPAGVFRVALSFEQKEVNKHPSVEMKLVVREVVEMADTSEAPPAVGDESGMLFMLDNEFGQGSLKEIVKPLAAATGGSSLREVLDGAKGMEVQVVSKPRWNKDKSQRYTNITKVIV